MAAPLNRLTRRWWRTVGREVDLAGAESWLDAPMAVGARVRDDWLRTLRATGEYVYSGAYGHRRMPGADRDSVHVAFPLEAGNVQVFLRPDVGEEGSLWLRSPGGGFGGDGAYVVVAEGRPPVTRTFAAHAPIRETFHVYVDDEGVLRTDHELRLWDARVVRLHYKLERRLET